MGHYRVAREEDALEIDVAHAIKREFVSFSNARRIKDASTVDEDIDASERSDNLRNKTLNFVNQRDVAREATGSATVCGNGINNLLRLPAIGAGYDSDAGALGGETPADGLADALRAARDQDDFADESHANLFLVDQTGCLLRSLVEFRSPLPVHDALDRCPARLLRSLRDACHEIRQRCLARRGRMADASVCGCNDIG